MTPEPEPPGPGHYSSFCEMLKVPAVTNSPVSSVIPWPVLTMGSLRVIPALLLALASCVTAGPMTSDQPELLDLWTDQNIDDINFGEWCSDRNWITILTRFIFRIIRRWFGEPALLIFPDKNQIMIRMLSIQEPILEMVSSDSQLDYRKDESGGCGNICHASLLTVAGLASYAVYNGLATDNFLTRRQEDISLSE